MEETELGQKIDEVWDEMIENMNDGPIVLGNISDFDEKDFLEAGGRFTFSNGKVLLWGYPKRPTGELSAHLFIEICSAVLQFQCKEHHLMPGGGRTVIPAVVDVFEGSRLRRKIADLCIWPGTLENTTRNAAPIACEISFRQETFGQLLCEGVIELSSSTDVCYSIIADMQENGERTAIEAVRIVVLERVLPLATDIPDQPVSAPRERPWPESASSAEISPQLIKDKEQLLEVKVVYDHAFSLKGELNMDTIPRIILKGEKIAEWALPEKRHLVPEKPIVVRTDRLIENFLDDLTHCISPEEYNDYNLR